MAANNAGSMSGMFSTHKIDVFFGSIKLLFCN